MWRDMPSRARLLVSFSRRECSSRQAPSDLAQLPIAAGQNRRVAIRQLSKKISRGRVPFLPYGDRRSIRGFGRRRTSCAAAPPFRCSPGSAPGDDLSARTGRLRRCRRLRRVVRDGGTDGQGRAVGLSATARSRRLFAAAGPRSTFAKRQGSAHSLMASFNKATPRVERPMAILLVVSCGVAIGRAAP